MTFDLTFDPASDSASDSASRKAALRQQARARRHSLTRWQQRQHALQLRDRVRRMPGFRQCRHIALYWARDGEIDPQPLLQLCWRSGKTVYLPCIGSQRQLEFRRYARGDRLHKNRFGIPEPGPGAPRREVAGLHLIVMPLVAFSWAGTRLGMGGGFYDRALRQVSGRGRGPYLLGAAHSCQQLEDMRGDHWDVAVHGIVTERERRSATAGRPAIR
ncbi:MAG: 5-formyltetrahydrofolate cyclo-ligase [Halieaceae bacterium]